MKDKIVITDYNFATIEPERKICEAAGYHFEAHKCKTDEEVIAAARDAVGILNQRHYMSPKVMDNLNKCKVIVRFGVGVDNIDVDAATKRGIIVSNVSSFCEDEVADHTISLLLAAARKLTTYDKAIRRGEWSYTVGIPIFQLQKCKLGVVGFGKIARNMVSKIRGMNFKEILVFDPYVDKKTIESYGAIKAELDNLITESDLITVNAPLTKGTRHMLSTEQFKMMKNHAIVVNTGRGPVIDEEALTQALIDGEIGVAGLDVLETEPIMKDNKLLQMDNVILTPHVGRYSEEAEMRLKVQAAQNAVRILAGNYPFEDIVNPEVVKKAT